MRRYWIESTDRQGELVDFRGEIFHHIFDVCRQEVGSRFEVLNETGQAALVEVLEVGKKSARARVIEERQIPALQTPWIHLVLSVPRFPVFDAVVEKAVELGVKSIQPVFSDFSFIRSASSLSDNKVDRWKKIIRSATQQSGRGDLMELASARPLDDFLRGFNRNEESWGLFAYEGGSTLGIKALGIKEELQTKRSSNQTKPRDLWLFVGSEGGFSHREVELFQSVGLSPVTLGPQVLRVETACMALVSVLKYEFDLMC